MSFVHANWYKSLLAIDETIPSAAKRICDIWRDYLDAVGVRLWLYNKEFHEFDLLSISAAYDYKDLFQRQNNQLPYESIAGLAHENKKIMPIPSLLHSPLLKKHSVFMDLLSQDLFSRLPTLICVPLINPEDMESADKKNLPLGVLDIHYDSPKNLNSIQRQFENADFLFLGSLSANALARGHLLERKIVFSKLDKIALNLVAPSDGKFFEERKQIYYQELLKIILEAVYAGKGSIFNAGSNYDQIRCCATTGIQRIPKFHEVIYRKGDGATWSIFHRKRIINSRNIQKDRRVPDFRGTYREERRIKPTNARDPFLGVPIKGQLRKSAAGVIRVLERRCHVKCNRLQNFSNYDVDLLKSIAAHVSPVFRLIVLEEQRQGYLGRMSHQVIQPTSGIQAFSSNMLDGIYSNPKEFFKKLRYIKAMASMTIRVCRGAGWVAHGKDFSFLASKEREARNLAQFILERILDMSPIREHDGISIKLINKDSVMALGEFRCVELYFDQVIQNVLHNAVKYSYPGTTIDVEADRVVSSLVINIASTGIPIEPQEKEIVFIDSQRGKWANFLDPNGTGQGLCICRQIMQGFQGTITSVGSHPSAESVHIPKKGLPPAHRTVFRITLPKAFL